jgi:hypothetical protein
MTPDQRLLALKSWCYPSGICDDDVLSVLVNAAKAPSEKAALRTAVKDYEAPFVARVKAIHKTFVDLEGKARAGDVAATCMPSSRSYWALIDPARIELDALALTLPGVAELRMAGASLRNCAAVCDERPVRLAFCRDVRTDLKEAAVQLRAAKSL